MEIKDYKAPQSKVLKVNVQGVLCGSENGNTEKFGMSDNSYEDSYWE